MKFFYHKPLPKTPRLLLFFAGWGVDEAPFIELLPLDSNLLIIFSYARGDEREIVDICLHYPEIELLAWSMGVWAAQEFMQSHPGILQRTTFAAAVNGTLSPINSDYGIDPQIFCDMSADCSAEVVADFQKKMCRRELARYQRALPQRSLADLQDELHFFIESVPSSSLAKPIYDFALIGRADFIIPARNQQRFWQNIASITLPLAHFPFYYWDDLSSCLTFCKGQGAGDA